jgi:DNA (cytosine-5)-methyltransferase 1
VTELVLSIFPGLDVLGMGFELEGFCVVAGPDVVWGRDVREFHPPRGKFDGIIGGDPCQSHSTLANLVRAKGLEPRFGDLTPEFARVVEEARPAWFLRENVPQAPDIAPEGYAVTNFLLDNCWLDSGNGLGEEQMRKRRFWFGWPEERGPAPNLQRLVRLACLELPRERLAAAIQGGHDQTSHQRARRRRVSVTGAHTCAERPKGGHGERYPFEEMLRLQGLSADCLELAPFTKDAKRKLVGNAVPLGMARELARAVKEATNPGRGDT